MRQKNSPAASDLKHNDAESTAIQYHTGL